jgi:hypothetical protein
MNLTPLQVLLRSRVVPVGTVAAEVGRGRVTVWRWATGESCPDPQVVPALIEFFKTRGHALDFNGCFLPTVTLTVQEAKDRGLA